MPYGLTSSRDRATHPVEDLLFLGLGMFAIFTFAYDLALLLPLSLRTVSLIALGGGGAVGGVLPPDAAFHG
jgi:hypothetical protein